MDLGRFWSTGTLVVKTVRLLLLHPIGAANRPLSIAPLAQLPGGGGFRATTDRCELQLPVAGDGGSALKGSSRSGDRITVILVSTSFLLLLVRHLLLVAMHLFLVANIQIKLSTKPPSHF